LSYCYETMGKISSLPDYKLFLSTGRPQGGLPEAFSSYAYLIDFPTSSFAYSLSLLLRHKTGTPQTPVLLCTQAHTNTSVSSVKTIITSLWDAPRKSSLQSAHVLSSFLICQVLLFHHFLVLSLLLAYSVIFLCPCFSAELSRTGPIFFTQTFNTPSGDVLLLD